MNQPGNGALKAAVLIVEQQAPMRAAIRDLVQLAFPGLPVIEAPDGAAALERFKACRPSFVLMDLNLTDANGLDLARTIKKLCPATMIAVTSIETNAHIAAQARAAGAAVFAGKDRLFDELKPLIGAAVALTQWLNVTPPSPSVLHDSPHYA